MPWILKIQASILGILQDSDYHKNMLSASP